MPAKRRHYCGSISRESGEAREVKLLPGPPPTAMAMSESRYPD